MAAYLSLMVAGRHELLRLRRDRFRQDHAAERPDLLLPARGARSSASRTRRKCRCRTRTGRARWCAVRCRTAMPASTMFALLKAALRQRPNEIIIGEIRGEEGAIAFQAMQTGHAVCATFHASTVEKLIQRLTGMPISVPKHVRRQPQRRLHLQRRAAAEREAGPPHPQHRRAHRLRHRGRRLLSSSRCTTGTAHNDTFEATGDMNSYCWSTRDRRSARYSPENKRGIYDEVEGGRVCSNGY